MAGHRTTFTAVEWLTLRTLVRNLERAKPEDQKRLRDGMRGLGFYISDFEKRGSSFSLPDLDHLLDQGEVKVRG